MEHDENMAEHSRSLISWASAKVRRAILAAQDAVSRHQHRWLKKLVKRELRARGPRVTPTADDISWRVKGLLVSREGLLVAAGATVLVHALLTTPSLLFRQSLTGLSDGWDGLVSDLWQVEASILGLTFVVAVLLIQSRAQASSSGELFRFFVRESYIVPIVVAGLVSVGIAGLVRLALVQSSWSALCLGALTLTTVGWFLLLFIPLNVFVYWRTLRLMNPSSVGEMMLTLLEQTIRDAVRRTAEVVAARELFRRVCEENGLRCDSYLGSRQDLEPIQATTTGPVTDIDLARLRRFSRYLQQTVAPGSRPSKPCRAILLVEFDSVLSPSHDVLARVHPDDLTEKAIRELRAAYKISPKIREPGDTLLSALALLKDEAGSSLRQNRAASFDRTLDLYLHVFDRLLSSWHAVGLPLAVSSSPLGDIGKTPLSVITSDLYDVIGWTIDTQDRELIGAAMYLPIRMLRVIVQFDEPRLYRTCSEMLVGAYRTVSADHQNKARGFAVDRSWRFLQEFARFSLKPELESDVTPEDRLSRLGAYLVLTVGTFNRLLKAAMDINDVAGFKAFGAAMDGLIESFDPERTVPQALSLEWELEDPALPDRERAKKEGALARYRLLASAKQGTMESVRLAWFGVSAWLLRQMRNGKIPWPEGSSMLAFAREHFRDLRELCAVYLQTQSERTSGLDWDGWVLFELPEGRAHWIDTRSWMESFYCVQGLRLTPDELHHTSTPIPPDRRLEHQLASLEETCTKLRETAGELEEVVRESDLRRIDNFLELHRRAVRVAQKEYEKWLVDQPISQIRWDAFREQFLEAWSEHAVIRAVVTAFGGHSEQAIDGAPDPARWSGIDTLIPKTAFVEDDYVLHDGWGSVIGQNLASEEDAYLLSRMLSGPLEELDCGIKRFADSVDSARHVLEVRGHEAQAVIIDQDFRYGQGAALREDIIRWGAEQRFQRLPGYVGVLHGLPVITPGPLGFTGAIIADLGALGHLIQYEIAKETDGLDFCLEVIDEPKAHRLLDGNAGLQSRLRAETREDAVWRLQQLVQLRVTDPVDFRLCDSDAAVRIIVSEDAEGDRSARHP